MPRTSDRDRIVRLLEGEGGSLGRREIIEGLGLSDDRYETVARELVDKRVAIKNLGRTGGLRLVLAESARRAGTGEVPAAPLEKELYPPFEKYLLAAAKNDESKSVVLNTHRTRAKKWETPDLAEVRVTPFPTIGQWELRVITYELKRQGAWSVDSVLQTATYNTFAHESWLVVPSGDDADWAEYFGKPVVEKATIFGIGLATFDRADRTFKKHMTPKQNLPLLNRQYEWLDGVLDRLGDGKIKTEIADNTRWARRRAED